MRRSLAVRVVAVREFRHRGCTQGQLDSRQPPMALPSPENRCLLVTITLRNTPDCFRPSVPDAQQQSTLSLPSHPGRGALPGHRTAGRRSRAAQGSQQAGSPGTPVARSAQSRAMLASRLRQTGFLRIVPPALRDQGAGGRAGKKHDRAVGIIVRRPSPVVVVVVARPRPTPRVLRVPHRDILRLYPSDFRRTSWKAFPAI